jgi:phosphoadenosine phosphosulfate reductase
MNAALVESALTVLRAAQAQAPATFSTSFGVEDMVLLDLIRGEQLAIEIFTLDTGRLHEETYALMREVELKYGRCVRSYVPDAAQLEGLIAAQGVNGFYDSVEQRKACCAVRKTEPLARALAGKRAWVTGLRSGQGATRESVPAQEWVESRALTKFNPLHDWTEGDVWAYVRERGVPYNALHDRFYPSIGCAPCTRAITPGEDVRAGRWWWENPESKECGLHVEHGKLTRIRVVDTKESA